jgi:hypothetical protein
MSAIVSQPLDDKDICVYVNYDSKASEIVKRHRNKKEEAIYNAANVLISLPFAYIDQHQILVKIDLDQTDSDLYLKVDLHNRIKTIVMMISRKNLQNNFNNDLQISLFLSNVLWKEKAIQKLHTNETYINQLGKKQYRHITTAKTVPAINFTSNDLLKREKTRPCKCSIM